jgi:hypothetical protein
VLLFIELSENNLEVIIFACVYKQILASVSDVKNCLRDSEFFENVGVCNFFFP